MILVGSDKQHIPVAAAAGTHTLVVGPLAAGGLENHLETL